MLFNYLLRDYLCGRLNRHQSQQYSSLLEPQQYFYPMDHLSGFAKCLSSDCNEATHDGTVRLAHILSFGR